jgi:hypothetical protein
MSDYLMNEYGFCEITADFLDSVEYPNVHMSWSEWESKAKEFGMEENQILELQSYLENNNQLTTPIRFGGKQWWLTSQEIQHVEQLKEQFPGNWENVVYKYMNRRTLGKINA